MFIKQVELGANVRNPIQSTKRYPRFLRLTLGVCHKNA